MCTRIRFGCFVVLLVFCFFYVKYFLRNVYAYAYQILLFCCFVVLCFFVCEVILSFLYAYTYQILLFYFFVVCFFFG